MGQCSEFLPKTSPTFVHGFNDMDGIQTSATLIRPTSREFYGTTAGGTIFRMTPSGTVDTLYTFVGADDYWYPEGLMQTADGALFGMTNGGGTNGFGTIFKLNSKGELTTLHNFDGVDGNYPVGGLVQTANGDFYGTTAFGGIFSECDKGCGTVFKITPAGTFTALYQFCAQSGCLDGESPNAGLILATDGNLYGTTIAGGMNSDGTVFRISTQGQLTTLHSFDGLDGSTASRQE